MSFLGKFAFETAWVMRKFFFWVLVPIAGILGFFVLLISIMCAFKGELVVKTIERQLRVSTGLPWSIQGPVSPAFFPYPGIALKNVRVAAASSEQEALARGLPPLIEVQELHVLLELPALLTGRVKLHLVELDTPLITFAYDKNGFPLWMPLPPADGTELEEDDFSLAENIDLGVVGIEVRGEGASPQAESRRARRRELATVPENLLPRAEQTRHALRFLGRTFSGGRVSSLPVLTIKNGTFVLQKEDGEKRLSLQDLDLRFNPQEPEKLIECDAEFSLPQAGLFTNFSGVGGLKAETRTLELSLDGKIKMAPPDSRSATGDFSSSVVWPLGGPALYLPDFRLEAEGDIVTASLKADFVREHYLGDVTVEHLSLPRWFKFGRMVPPGLQHALHDLNGTFWVYGTKQMVEGANIEAYSGDLLVRGKIGCPDYSEPVVVSQLNVEHIDLDKLLPFLSPPGVNNPEHEKLEFDMAFLVPYIDDDEDDVGFDIRIHSDAVRVHGVDADALDVRIFRVRPKTVRVAFEEKKVLGGSIEGWLDITKRLMKMYYSVDKAELALLPENKTGSVKIGGKVTGTCEIDVNINEDRTLSDDWIMSINGKSPDFKISSGGKVPWWLSAGSVEVSGSGPLHSEAADGITISGPWNISAKKIQSSWNAKGADSLEAIFDGSLRWTPKNKGAGSNSNLYRVDGNIAGTGHFMVPLGKSLAPVKGKLGGNLVWDIPGDILRLDEYSFDGMGGYVGGNLEVDASGKDVKVNALVKPKLALKVFLKEWDMLPSGSVTVPELLTGSVTVDASPGRLVLSAIDLQADGDPVAGTVTGTFPSGKEANWNIRLSSERLNLDNFFPPATNDADTPPPSTEPWDLSFLEGLSVDAEIKTKAMRFHGLNLINSTTIAALQRGRFSLQTQSQELYGGASTLLAQGTFVPSRSEVNVTRFLGELREIDLGRVLRDMFNDDSFGGKADVILDLNGKMTCEAELLAGLSGIWSVKIKDGMYPAFLASEKSGLRNTFSQASAGGVVEKGVMKFDNFILTGSMVDMIGIGWVDLVQRKLDIQANISFAKVPTIPVRLHGKFASLSTTIHGVQAVGTTVLAAGSTVFSLIRGILELPGYVIDAASGDKKK